MPTQISILREDEKPDAKPYADTDQHHQAIELHLLPPMFTSRDGSIQLLLMTFLKPSDRLFSRLGLSAMRALLCLSR